MVKNNSPINISYILSQPPDATAHIKGSNDYPDIAGYVKFYQTKIGVVVAAEIYGLPTNDDDFPGNIHGFHIHSGTSCTGGSKDPFADALTHFNPAHAPHPYHAGDMPPLFSDNGYSYMAFLTNRFYVHEVMGRTVVIHSSPDDFTTQPAGNSGTKIACGKILR